MSTQIPQTLKITLDTPKVVKEIPASQIKISEIEVLKFEDSPSLKTVKAYTTNTLVGTLTLWEGDAYTSIGDWTQSQAVDRIKEIINLRG